MEATPDLLTAQELGERLGVSRETILKWTRRGRIPALRITRKVIRYHLEAVIGALVEQAKVSGGEGVRHG